MNRLQFIVELLSHSYDLSGKCLRKVHCMHTRTRGATHEAVPQQLCVVANSRIAGNDQRTRPHET